MKTADDTPSVQHGSLDEKADESTMQISALDIEDKDEALKLVGLERTAGIDEERFLKVRRKLHYNLAALAFYLGFLIWVFPTMYISQKLRLGKYLGTNIVLWGIIMMLHAVPNSFGPFFVLRILLGMLESCVSPALVLIISMFYKKNEQARRISWFYFTTGIGNMFGFVAYGISFDMRTGFAPYKVLYLLCGAMAITVGIAVLIWMPDSPLHARFLSQEERIVAVERVRDDQGGTENKRLKKEQLKETLLDVRTWLIVLSTLIRPGEQGPSSLRSVSAQSALKSPHSIPMRHLLAANYIVLTFGSCFGVIYAYNASNTSGHTKKVTLNAMTLAAFCVGNIIGSEIFQAKDAPHYIPGKVTILVLLSVQFFLCFLLRWVNLHMNAKKKQFIEEMKERHSWSDGDIAKERERHAFLDLTDKQ
ncbi:hypothetical protein PHLCEN_2v2915 [Hermanssonia centrifuga]|uniref:Uncharacterized protein n=1 Tax=Hermanssonia centrifuga TaxID=98765 RepID=A0A2R6RIB5_9APHY|nr:hypothetical protein PHLCEN_2v2915 [Hermanssonia centrifuga]